MEDYWVAERHRLRQLRQAHPDWSKVRLAEEMKRSYSWTKDWCGRLAGSEPTDMGVLQSQSRARKNAPEPIAPEVVQKILLIRDEPPEGLRRTPGPVAIKYYVHRDEELQAQGYHLPTSTSTIWSILDQNDRIGRAKKPEHTPLTRAAPMEAWQIDFKTVGTVPPEPGGKLRNGVETLNMIDSGSAILLDNPVRIDFNAETAIEALAETLRRWGCPGKMSFDRDPRFVGAWTAGDFPSPLTKLLMCLDIEVEIHPPHRPDKNCYVERYNRTYEYEAIQVYLPETLGQVEDMNIDVRRHYNYERPHQALPCGNQPPCRAFPDLPTLPPLPETIDPDHWLQQIDGDLFTRRIDASGTIRLDKHRYYIRRDLRGHTVVLQIDAPNQAFNVLLENQLIKTVPLKGLYQTELPFETYLELIQQEAISQWRLYLRKHPRRLPLAV